MKQEMMTIVRQQELAPRIYEYSCTKKRLIIASSDQY